MIQRTETEPLSKQDAVHECTVYMQNALQAGIICGTWLAGSMPGTLL